MGRRKQPGVDKIGEDWVKDRVKEILNQYNIPYFMPSASGFGKAGAHDFITCAASHFLSIETKAGKNKASDLQVKFARDMQKQGGICLLINEFNYSEVERVILELTEFGETYNYSKPLYPFPYGHRFE